MNNRRLLIILGISIVLVILAVITLLATRHTSTPAHHGPVTSNNPDTAAAVPTIQEPSTDLFGNRLDATGNDAGQALPQTPGTRPNPSSPGYLTAPPSGLDWQRGWGGAALPVSGSDGPERIRHGIAEGFADTPQGAALAACDAIARALAAPDGVWQNVVHQRYLGGGQGLIDQFARARSSTADPAQYAVVPAGVRVLGSYRPDFAVVQIAARSGDGWVYSTWPMAWNDADWRVRVPDDPQTLWEPAIPVPMLTDFGQWTTS